MRIVTATENDELATAPDAATGDAGAAAAGAGDQAAGGNAGTTVDGQTQGGGQEPGDGRNKGGDLLVALHKERRKVKALQDELQRFQGATGESGAAETAPAAPDFSMFELTEDELDAMAQGDGKAFNSKLKGALAAAVEYGRKVAAHEAAALTGAAVSAARVETLIGKFSIFQDEDEGLAQDAMSAAVAAVGELADGATEADAEAALADVAKRFSRYKVARAGDSRDGVGGAAAGVVTGGGSASAAHLRTDGKPFGSIREAIAAASREADAFLSRKAAGGH
jgi:hypothetical protein